MFADDTIISFSSNSTHTINNAVDEHSMVQKTWLDENKTSLNAAKTQSLLIGGRYKINALERTDSFKPSLSIGDEQISSVTGTKYLRLQVDQYLNWEHPVLLITKKFSKGIGTMVHYNT